MDSSWLEAAKHDCPSALNSKSVTGLVQSWNTLASLKPLMTSSVSSVLIREQECEMALVMSTVLRELVQVFMSKEFILGMLTALTGSFLYSRLRLAQIATTPIKTVQKKQTKYDDNIKMVILVRSDLNMTKGKAAAQACHAVLASYKDASKRDPSLLEAWERSGQAKVTLKVESEEELMGLVKKAREYGVTAQYIRDAGRTQLAPNTTTVAAVGPAPCNLLDLVTGHLKLY